MKSSLRILIPVMTVLSFISYSFAQSTGTSHNPEITESNQVNADIGGVKMEFCNQNNRYKNNNNLTLEINPGETQDICMNFKNEYFYNVELKVNFIDGGMTNDLINPRRSCQNEDSKDYFGQYVQDNDTLITIPAGKTVNIHRTMQLPDTHIGYNYGCLTYSIPKQKPKIERKGIGYEVVIRKAGLIDVKVAGELKSDLELLHFTTQDYEPGTGDIIRGPLLVDEFPTFLDVYTTIKNTGTVPQKVKGVGFIKDFFDRKVDLLGADLTLLPNEEKTIHLSAPKERRRYFNYFGRTPTISWYRGLYKAYVQLNYTPQLAQGHDDPNVVGGNYLLGGKIFLVPWWLLILLALLALYFLYRMFKKQKQKKQKSHADVVIEISYPKQHEL